MKLITTHTGLAQRTSTCSPPWYLQYGCCFFDDQDIITTHFKHNHELHKLEESRDYYLEQIENTKKELEQLKSDPATLEKYAREKYWMKKDNEDLFILPEAKQ